MEIKFRAIDNGFLATYATGDGQVREVFLANFGETIKAMEKYFNASIPEEAEEEPEE